MFCKNERLHLSEIQPSELYLSRDRLFFVDGHHRAFKLMKEGREKIEVYRNDEDLDWLEYLIYFQTFLRVLTQDLGNIMTGGNQHITNK